MSAPAVNPRAVVSRAVESLLGPEIVLAWAQVIETKPMPCVNCDGWTDPLGSDPVTISAAVFDSEDDDIRPTVEIVLAHAGCGASRVMDYTTGRSATTAPQGPRPVSLVMPGGVRAVMVWGLYGMRLGVPVGDRETIDVYIRDLLGFGYRLVTGPPLEFDEPIEGWSLHIDTRRVELRGPGHLALLCPTDCGPDPRLVAAIAEQRRCLVLASAHMTADGFTTEGPDMFSRLTATLERKRAEGHLVGGVVPATVTSGLAQAEEGEGRALW